MLKQRRSLFLLLLIIFIINTALAVANTSNTTNTDNNKKNKYYTLEVSVVIKDLPNSKFATELTKNVTQDLLIFQAISEPKITETRIENLHDRTPKEILYNLQSIGFYHAKIINSSLTEINYHHYLAKYEVELGQPTNIKAVDIKFKGELINNTILLEKLYELSKKFLHINQQLTHKSYEKTKELILNKLHDYGFLNAQFITSKIEVDLKNFSANIIFIIDSKQQYYFGPTTFNSDVYDHAFLKKFLPFKEHDSYSTDGIMQLKNNLLNSDLFSKVRIDVKNLSEVTNNVIPINVRVYKKPTNRYSGSIGVTTDDSGLRGSIGYTKRKISKPGHQINLNAIGSKIRREVNANYTFLGKNPMLDKYSFGVTAQREEIKKKINKNAEIYLQKSKKHTLKQQFWTLSFLAEGFKELPASQIQHTHFLIPNLRLTWTNPKTKLINNYTNYDPINSEPEEEIITYGNKLDIIAKAALRKILSTTNLAQLTVNEKLIYPLFYDLNIIIKGSLGFTLIKNINNLPTSLRFFAGGDRSIRGFAYKSLGPTSTDVAGNTDVVGGKHLVTASFELEKLIYQQINFLTFLDLGNALNTFNSFNLNKLAIGTGIGVSYRTPIGAICAYLAKPIKTPKDGLPSKKLRFHLTFNTNL